MRMNRVRAHLRFPPGAFAVCSLAAVLLAVAGCGDDASGPIGTGSTSVAAADSSSSGMPNAEPTLEATIAGADACATASEVEIRATRFGCVSPPPAPCTLPEPLQTDVGDRLQCPVEGDGVWRLEVEAAGRYYVELVSIAADGTETAQCLTNTAEDFVLVDDAAFMDNPTIVLTAQPDPCPSP